MKKEIAWQLVIYSGIFLFSLFWIKPSLLYFSPYYALNNPLDIYQGWFISEVPLYPGSFSYGIASMLFNFLSSDITGSLLITVSCFITAFLTGQCLKMFNIRSLINLRFIPVITLLVHFSTYNVMLSDVVTIILTLIIIRIYRFSYKRRNFFFYILTILSFLLVYIWAPYGYIPFSAFALITILWRKKSRFDTVFLLISGFLIPIIITVFLAGQTFSDTYTILLPLDSEDPLFYLRLFLYTQFALFPFIPYTADLLSKKTNISTRTGKFFSFFRNLHLQYILIIILATVSVRYSSNNLLRNSLIINRCLINHDWDGVLQKAGERPASNFSSFHAHAVNRALYHKGKLLEDMMKYPQYIEAFPLDPKQSLFDNISVYRHAWLGWTYLELGLVNHADHLGDEALTALSFFPEGLKLQAVVYMTKNMPEAGLVYLNKLDKVPCYREWASEFRKKLKEKPGLGSDSLINHYRSVSVRLDPPVTNVPLIHGPASNPKHRMMFEYLSAVYLINCNLDALADGVKQLRSFGYKKLPKLYEEALLLYEIKKGEIPGLYGYKISRESREKVTEAVELFSSFHGNRAAALDDMSEKFGSSYVFFYLYGKTGYMLK